MNIETGQTILHYQIAEKIGEGGMGEVYRASDQKLARDVAIKVLPHELSDDPERLARFHREAQVLASLNHPNIAAIYGLEEIDDTRFLVLELVEGPDLAELLRQGPVAPEQAVAMARQIAAALEVAHEQGIVHRDLKPANVKLSPDGKIKVLDFGLAKALEGGSGRDSDMSQSPTITSLSTRAGVILGTAAYMSPEQARGAVVDRRADIWAFGCVLLELLTGRSPFQENTVSDTLAAILRAEPDWKGLPENLSPALRRLLRRCLDKDPARRLRDIGEARIALDDILSGEAFGEDATPAQPSNRRRVWGVLGAVLLTAVITTAIVQSLRPSQGESAIRRFEVIRGPFQYKEETAPALSPDGHKILFIRDGFLWVRRLDQVEPRRLDGTDGATKPAWSPDSESIVFCSKGDLKTVPAGGGSTTTVAIGIGEIDATGGVTWGPDGRILFSSGNGGFAEVSATGGDSREILLPDGEHEADLHQPSFLPDGSVVFVVHRLPEGQDTIAVLTDGVRKTLLRFELEILGNPVYSTTGHIVFRRTRSKAGLWAVPFSLAGLEVTGEPFLITPQGTLPSVSDDGTLLYVNGAVTGLHQLVWVSRDGVIGESVGQPQTGIAAPALSPDGTRVAVMGQEGEIGNIWVYDIQRQTRTRLTFGNARDWDPAWTADGRHIIYWDGTTRALSMKAADGTGELVRLVEQNLPDSGVPSLSLDGKWMAFWVKPTVQEQDLWYMALDGDTTPKPIVATKYVEDNPRISPDGNYLAYTSDESGSPEIYLTRFPGGGGKWQVSVERGRFPVWSPVGGELFFLDGSAVKQVDVTTEPTMRLGTPRTLFDAAEIGVDVIGESRFEIARDGRRFLMIQELRDNDVAPSLVINYDWISQFRDRN